MARGMMHRLLSRCMRAADSQKHMSTLMPVRQQLGVGQPSSSEREHLWGNRSSWLGYNNPAVRCFSTDAPMKSSGGFGRLPPITPKSLLMMMMFGAGIVYATNEYKDQKVQKVMQQTQSVAGKAAVGGPFTLTDQDGKPFSDSDLHGEFALLYFGFTYCPDICPDELEKVSEAINIVEKQTGGAVKVAPVFISVDPDRDTPSKVKAYVKEFHPRMIGLTGEFEAVKKVSKSYRVYFSKTGDSNTDYLVDHSIIHYLINPAGEFVTFYSKNYTAQQLADSVQEHVANWKKDHPEYHKGMDIKAPAPPVKA